MVSFIIDLLTQLKMIEVVSQNVSFSSSRIETLLFRKGLRYATSSDDILQIKTGFNFFLRLY